MIFQVGQAGRRDVIFFLSMAQVGQKRNDFSNGLDWQKNNYFYKKLDCQKRNEFSSELAQKERKTNNIPNQSMSTKQSFQIF